MPPAKVLTLSENRPSMTIADGLAFIERTRRQLERFDDSLPHAEGTTIAEASDELGRNKRL